MSDCGVCIDGYDECGAEFFHAERRKSRKEHRCSECNGAISRGEMYEHACGNGDGFFVYKSCEFCSDVREAFYCGVRMYGVLWEDMQECVFPRFSFKCLEPLKPEFRSRLIQKWQEWKGLSQ